MKLSKKIPSLLLIAPLALFFMAGIVYFALQPGKPPAQAPTEQQIHNFMASSRYQETQGRQLYLSHCSRCHGPKGEGRIGPKLSDYQVKTGQSPTYAISQIVTHGITRRGMPSWKYLLTTEEIISVSHHVSQLSASSTTP